MTLSLSPGMARIGNAENSLMSRVIGMPFADWRRFVGFEHTHAFTVNRGALTSAIRRAMIVCVA